MWRLIRGCGLSYGYGVAASPSEGRVVFSLYRASNAVAAYSRAKDIVVTTLPTDPRLICVVPGRLSLARYF